MSLIKKLKEKIMGEEDYLLNTHEDTDKEIQSGVRKRIGLMFILVPVVGFIAVIIIKSAYPIWQLQLNSAKVEEKQEEDVKNTDFKLSNDEIWKTKSEEEQNKLSKDMLGVKKSIGDLAQLVTTSTNDIKNVITANDAKYIKNNEELKSTVTSIVEDTNKKIENIEDENSQKITQLKQEIEDGKVTSTQVKYTKLSAANLFPLSKIEIASTQPKSSINNSSTNSQSKKSSVTEYEYVEIGESEESNLSTLDNYVEVLEEDDEVKEFGLVAGFAKATLVTGGDLKTLAEGNASTTPIFLSLDTKIRVANNKELDLRECLLRATGKGDFTTSRGEITLVHMSCSLTDDEGNDYKIDQNVVGWVFDEVGSYGVKGRLVTKEGEIMAKSLPLAFLETGLSILNEKAKSSQTTPDLQIGTQATTGIATNAGGTIVEKMGEYWMKYLDGLNPIVSFKPGRKVVVAFQGGEMLKVEKYTPADVVNFEEDFEDIYNEES